MEHLKIPLHSYLALEMIAVGFPTILLTFITVNLTHTVLNKKKWIQVYSFEILSVVLPLMLVLTILVEYVVFINLVLIILCVMAVLINWKCSRKTGDESESVQDEKKAFITNTRSTINILTVIAILAVDFKIFPLRFHKTHKYGFSFMDVGVGAYVFSNGIVAPEIRGRVYTPWQTLKSVAPLLIIGIGRFILTSVTNYQVNVTEYGVHWNFFITLAVTRLISALLLSVSKCNILHCFVEGVAILAIHQLLLTTRLEKYVFSNAGRDNFIDANREGIVSTLGYIGVYFLSVSFGCLCTEKNRLKLLLYLIATNVILGVSTYVLFTLFNISRCLANPTYCVWILFIAIAMLTLFYMMEVFSLSFYNKLIPCAPFIFEAINFNGLMFFVIGNVMTGVINMIFITKEIQMIGSLTILSVYLIFTCFFTCVLYVKKIKLKLQEQR